MILLDGVRPYMVEWRRVYLDIPDSLGKTIACSQGLSNLVADFVSA
jgi:hypothetical protein